MRQRVIDAPLPEQAAAHAHAREIQIERDLRMAHVAVRTRQNRRRSEQQRPLHRRDARAYLLGRVASGVQRTDDRAHARAHDDVRIVAELLEPLEHTDVGEAARAAAGQHDRFLAVTLELLRARGDGAGSDEGEEKGQGNCRASARAGSGEAHLNSCIRASVTSHAIPK